MAAVRPRKDSRILREAMRDRGGQEVCELRPIVLPRPEREGGKSMLAALRARRTNRNISDKPLPPRVLSNLLWAAFGVNRGKGRGPFGGTGRTAGSASNAQEVDIYVALAGGTYVYEALSHQLRPVVARDLRKLAISPGQRDMLGDAPIGLIYVADIARYKSAGFQEPGLWDVEVQKSYFNVAVGLIAGNVEVFAASAGLASWFHNCDKRALGRALGLRPEQRALYGHTVGYPAGK